MAYGHPKHHKVSPISAVNFDEVPSFTARGAFEQLRSELRLSTAIDAAEDCATALETAARYFVAATRTNR
jgi:hypothetical protein